MPLPMVGVDIQYLQRLHFERDRDYALLQVFAQIAIYKHIDFSFFK